MADTSQNAGPQEAPRRWFQEQRTEESTGQARYPPEPCARARAWPNEMQAGGRLWGCRPHPRTPAADGRGQAGRPRCREGARQLPKVSPLARAKAKDRGTVGWRGAAWGPQDPVPPPRTSRPWTCAPRRTPLMLTAQPHPRGALSAAGGFSPAKPGKASTVREQTLRRCGVPRARRRQGRAGEALGRGPLPPQLGVRLGRSPSPQPCRSSFLISLGFWGLVAEAQCPRGPVTWAVPACVIAKFYQRQTAGRTRSGAETLGSVSFLGWTFQRGAGSTALLGGCGSSARRQGRAGHPQSRVQITELHVQKRTRRL